MQDAGTTHATAGDDETSTRSGDVSGAPTARALTDEQRRRLAQRLAARRGAELVHDADATVAPLSPTQEQIWLSDRIAGGPAYNAPEAVHFRGPIDLDALQRALDAVVAAHHVLRTTYHLGASGAPEQRVEPPAPVTLHVVDVSDRDPDDVAAAADDALRAAAEETLDLATGPVISATLVRRAPDDHILQLVIHHVAVDGWSRAPLWRDLARAYAGEPIGDRDALQYTDYARWQRQRIDRGELDPQLDWWTDALRGIPDLLDLPTDRPRPPVQRFEGAHHHHALAPDADAALKAVASAEGTTTFMAQLALVATYLHRITGSDDIVIGTPTANRPRVELESLVGNFANTIAVRTRFDDDPSFRAVLGAVRESLVGALRNQEVPFTRVVERVAPRRDASRTPVFQVMMITHTERAAEYRLGAAVGTRYHHERAWSKFDLTVHLHEIDGGLTFALEYNTDLWDADTARRMGRQLEQLARSATAEPDAPVSGLRLLPGDGEEHQLLVAWNDTAKSFSGPPAVHHFLTATAVRVPDAVALEHGAARLTYRELDERANQLAHHLRDAGAGPGTRVGIHLERSLDLVVSLLAVMKAGAAYVPLDPSFPVERLAYMTGDASLRVLVTQESLAGTLPVDDSVMTVVVDREAHAIAARAATAPVVAVAPDDLMYVIYTSGSTGRPKGVMVEHASVVNFLEAMAVEPGLAPHDRLLAVTTLSFDIAGLELFLPLVVGATCVLASRIDAADPVALRRLLCDHSITVMQATPATWRMLVDSGWEGDRALRVLCGGEALPPALAQALLPRVGELWNLYGPTETTIWSTVQRVVPDAPVSIGRPIANTTLYVLDERRAPVPIGVAGELYIGGDGVARGYQDRPDLTNERFVANPYAELERANAGIDDDARRTRLYRTGDLVRYRPDGRIEFLGRVDHQVKVRGYRIELGEIEAVLEHQPAVDQAVVVARPDPSGTQHLVAYVMLTRSDAVSPAELRRAVGDALPPYMVPSVVVVLDAMPRTPNGKTDRKALPDPQWSLLARDTPYVAPRNDRERALVDIWRDVLHQEQVGVDDDFFAIGGQSLLAAQLVARVDAAFDVDLPIHALFSAPTVARLADALDAIDAAHRGEAAETAEAADAGGPAAAARLEQLSDDRRAELARRVAARRRTGAPKPIPARPRDDIDRLPLSHSQELLWLLEQVTGGGWAYNAPEAVRFRGALDVAALRRALDALVAHNEILRTVYRIVDDAPVQVIEPPRPVDFTFVDLAHRGAAAEAAAHDVLRGFAERAFDLAVDQPIRVALVRVAEDEHLLGIVIHHIAVDGWSRAPFWEQLGALYEQASAGADPALPAQRIQYADFALWQRELLAAGVQAEQLGYWREQLRGIPSLLDLPTDRPRPAVQSFRGAHHHRMLASGLHHAMRQLGQNEGCTLFMLAIAVLATYLHRVTGQDDIVIGTPIANRNRVELEDLIGYFANTIAVRTRFQGDPTFRDVLAQVRATVVDALRHQEVPFGEVVIEVAPDRDLSRTPIFQVLLVVHTERAARRVLGAAEGERFTFERGWSKFDLTIGMGEHPDGLGLGFEYSTDLFDAATIERMGVQYETLVRSILDDPDRAVSALPLTTAADEAAAMAAAHGPARAYRDVALHELFEATAARTPDAVALECGAERFTYADLDRRADALAARLRALGVGRDVPVGVCAPRGAELVVGLLATLKAGGACLPLDPEYPLERLAHMLRDSGAPVVLTVAATASRVPSDAASVELCVDELWAELGREPVARLAADVTSDDLAYVLYTSGSTGRPKGVLLAHRGLANHARAAVELYGITAADRVLQFCSPSFDISIEELFPAFAAGATVVVRTDDMPLGGLGLCEWLERRGITLLDLPTAFWHEWVGDLEAFDLEPHDGLRAVVVGGEKASAATLAVWRRRVGERVRWFNTYGPTEASVIATAYEPGASFEATRDVPIGRPIANAIVHVLDAHGRPAPIGVRGELHLGGAGLARGYLHDDALTAARFVPDPTEQHGSGRLYRTGDLARRLADGTVEFAGRVDHQLKIRGFRIEPGEIEAVLGEHPAVAEAAVTAVHDERRGALLAAYVTLVPGSAPGLERELRRFAAERLPGYMTPAAVCVLGELPRTPNGKVDTTALPRPAELAPVTSGDVPAPRDDVERALAAIWCDVLGIDAGGLSIHESFFDLGGHSLLAVRMFGRIERELAVRLPLAALIQNQTVAQLAELVRADATVAFETLVALQPSGTRTPIFFVHGPVGEGIIYLELVRRLGRDQPAYAFQDRGLGRALPQFTSIEAMAAAYIDELRNVQPTGPYVLGGFCMGGVVAYEMARQLQERGDEVALVLLIDAAPLGHLAGGRVYTTSGRIKTHLRDFATLRGKARWEHTWETTVNVFDRVMRPYWWRFVKTRYLARGRALPKRLHDVEAVNWMLASQYVAPPYRGRVALLRKEGTRSPAGEQYRRDQWARLLEGGEFEVVDIDSPAVSHMTLLKEPHVRVLAAAAREVIDAALERSSASAAGTTDATR